MKKSIVFVHLFFLLLPFQQLTKALEVKILGPSGGTLAPNTEYGFGVWISNPGAWWDDSNPTLVLVVSGGTVTLCSAGTFEHVGATELMWDSSQIPQQKGLIGYVEIKTEASGQLTLNLTGSIWGGTGSDQKNYSIATLSGQYWSALSELANSRALTNADFASLYISLCYNDTPPVSGYELFSHIPESQESSIRAVKLLTTLLGGFFDPVAGLGDIFLNVEQNWAGLPDFLGAFYLWSRFAGAVDKTTWYWYNVSGYGHPLAPVFGSDPGYLNYIYCKEMNEAAAWENRKPLAALSYLKAEEEDISKALLIVEHCIHNANSNSDVQGGDFFRALKKHLEGEQDVIDKLKWIVQTLAPLEELNLLASWKFDEGSGFIAGDSSGNGKDGIIDGATWTTGKIGDALSFDGFDDWVDVPDDISPEHITLTAWIYPTGVYDIGDHGSPIITKETGRGTPPWSESFAWRLRITPFTHKLQLQCFTPTGVGGGSPISDTVLEMGNWYHVAGTYDGTRTKIFINGNLERSHTASISEPLVTSNLPTAIGHLPNWSVQWFQGIIDELRVYGRALSDYEIEALVSEPDDRDADGILNDIEDAAGTDPFDDDTDNDGLLDGPGSGEDVNANGIVDASETDPRSADTDGDGIQDGTELGLVAPEGFDTDLTIFVPDADPSSTTDPTNPDTDGDGLLDGEEDLNGNGAVDPGETDPSAITGLMDLDPDVLNLKSKGKWVTCYLELPQGYDTTDITLSSVALNSTIPPEFSVYEFGDYNTNGVTDLMVKFNRELLIGVLGSVEHGKEIVLTLTGQLSNGTKFEGLNTIRVIGPGHG